MESLLGLDDEFSIDFYAFKTVIPSIYIYIILVVEGNAAGIATKQRE